MSSPAITPEIVAHIATLSRLALTPDESVKLASDIHAVLGHASDLSAFEPAMHVGQQGEALLPRADAQTTPTPQDKEDLLAASPRDTEGGYIHTPKAL